MSEEAAATDAIRLKQALLAIRALRARVEQLESARADPIAIVGMACRFPGGATDPDRYWEMLQRGVDGTVDIPSSRMALDRLYDPKADPETSTTVYTRRAGLLADVERFDAAFFRISPREALSLDPQHRLALEVAWEALERAAIAPSSLAGTRSGVVLGITLSEYDHLIRQAGPQNIDTYHLTGNCLNFAAGRIAYVLGVHGPTLVLDTACSSSLVAIHVACQSLRTHEADLMLAGGVNVILLPDGTLMVCKMRMVAPDGRCKTFDASADGFGRGEGCGVVVLKRLSDALRDRDPIVAVIRSTAINQDGASSGLTVPNGMAQQALIREALAKAGIGPDDVGYLECHGTGTALGDPIEVAALGEVLAKTRARRPLAIGSVKTNFGHLESASGVAGLMKAALVVQQGAIPPHLHLRAVNPQLSLRDGNITIPTELTPWPQDGAPRIAGVSSFGASGTNAHAILEEPPAMPARTSSPAPTPELSSSASPPPTPAGFELLCLSARTPTALQELAGRYAAALATPVELADLCATAALGRDAFEHRVALPGSDRATFVERLAAIARGDKCADVERGELTERRRDVVFLFPGQGAQYRGMGKTLYAQVAAFRAAFDDCCRWLDPELGRSLRDLVFAEDVAKEGGLDPLHQTRWTQPAIFAIEHALSQMWRSFGVEPAVVLGHSIGEYVAACCAGVLTLEDACRLVAARGRLMHERSSPGAMAALFAAEPVVAAAIAGLEAEVGIAAVNGPSNVVVSGTEGAVAKVIERAAAQGVKSKRLTVSHAFHSPLMDPVLAPFRAVAQSLRFGEPRIPLLSNLTGAELSGRDAASADYWCRHVREPVRFAASMEWLEKRNLRVFLETGPGSTLVGLAQQSIPASGRSWIASLRQGREEWPHVVQAAGALYVGGAAPAWDRFYAGRDVRRIVAPTYPFEGKRFRKTLTSAPLAAAAAAAGSASTDGSTPEALLYEVEWQPKPHKSIVAASDPPSRPPSRPAGRWLLLADRGGVAESLARELTQRGEEVVVARADAMLAAIATSHGADRAVRGIVHCLGLDLTPTAATTVQSLQDDHEHGLMSLLQLAQALPEPGGGARAVSPVWIITRGAAPVDVARNGIHVAASALWGAGRALALERPDDWGGLLDLDPEGDRDECARVADELLASDGEDQLAWRRGQRFVPRLQAAAGIAPQSLPVKSDRTYLVTGAMGEAGRRIVRLLVQRGARHLLLVGRRGASTREGPALLDELHAAGIETRVVHADVARAEDVARIAEAIAAGPPLAGVVHAAGIARFEKIPAIKPQEFRAVLQAKVAGTWMLHELTRDVPLDFFVCFSSIASVWGSVGQLHYAAANRFLDAVAHLRRQLSLPATSISFSPWQGGGAMHESLAQFMKSIGVTPVDPAVGMPALEAAIACGRPHLVLAQVEWGLFRGVIEAHRRRPLFEALPLAAAASDPMGAPRGDLRAQLAAATADDRQDLLVGHIQEQMAELMGFGAERPDPRRGFIELGIDSLMAVTLRNRLQTSLAVALPVTFIFDHPTAELLADHLLAKVIATAPATSPLPAAAAAAAAGRAALVNEVRELSEGEIEVAIAQQLKELGLH